MRRITSRLSFWGAAGRALAELEKGWVPTGVEGGVAAFPAIGLDAEGEVLGRWDDGRGCELVLADSSFLEGIRRAFGVAGAGEVEPLEATSPRSSAHWTLARRFLEFGRGPGSLWPPALLDLESASWADPPELPVCVDWAPLSVRERVEMHVEACPKCRRPAWMAPEDPGSIDLVSRWRSLWEPLGLSAAESIAWTELLGCRPEATARLRAAGLTPRQLAQRFYDENRAEEWERSAAVDGLLAWLESGFTLAEVAAWMPALESPDELSAARLVRARGLTAEEQERSVAWDGGEDLLVAILRGDSAEGSFQERVATLEGAGVMTKVWMAGA